MKLKVYVYAKLNEYTGEPQIRVTSFDGMEDMWGPMLAEREIDIPEPLHADMAVAMVAAWRAEQQQIRADAEVKAQEIEQRIGKILAIEA